MESQMKHAIFLLSTKAVVDEVETTSEVISVVVKIEEDEDSVINASLSLALPSFSSISIA
jgi:hypothetical protein